MYKIALLASLLAVTNALYAQKGIVASNEEIGKLKGLFKDEPIVALKASTTYEFAYDKLKGLIVRQGEAYQYLALKPNASFVVRNYFDNESRVDSYSLKNEKGRSVPHDKYCGHYGDGEIFYSDAQVCAYNFKIDLQGQTVFYESAMTYDDPKYLSVVYFHDNAPSADRTVQFSIPNWANVELLEKNFEGTDIEKSTRTENESTIVTYSIKNLKSFPKDSNLPGGLHFLPHLIIQTKSYTYNDKTTNVLSSVDELYGWYSSVVKGVQQNYDELKPIVQQVTANLKNNEEKIKAIYYWVQDNIKYIAFEDGLAAFKPQNAHEVYYNRYGDCKGMANLLKDMLTIAGFDARLTWIGTDRIPYNHDVSALVADNHMICTVFDNGKEYILDATEKYNTFGVYAERIQGQEILIEDGAKYKLDRVPEEPLQNYAAETTWKYKITNNELSVSGKTDIRGEEKKMLLNIVSAIPKDDLGKFLKSYVAVNNNSDNVSIVKNPEFDREKPLIIDFSAKLTNQLYAHNKELYLDLDLTEDFKDEPMEKDRAAPYKFSSRILKKYIGELTLPDGYIVEYLPSRYHVENNHFAFDLNYQVKGNKIIYTKEIRVSKSILPVSEFSNWNKAIEGLSKFYNDQVILKLK